MTDIMYDLNSVLIATVLLVSMLLAITVGHRVGMSKRGSANASTLAHVNAIQASLLGLLALLLGFTFSLALQRFDSRSESVVREANAISTAYLRAQLLPVPVRAEAKRLLQSYVGLRARAGSISLDSGSERQAYLTKANAVVAAIWRCAQRAAEEDKSPVTSGLFIQSINEAIDSLGRRDAELSRHVPEVIWFLLYGTFVVAGGVIGYSTGFAGHRPSVVTYMLVVLIVVLAFIIIDLDRPRRGLIQVDQSSLTRLKTAIDAAERSGQPPDSRELIPPQGATDR